MSKRAPPKKPTRVRQRKVGLGQGAAPAPRFSLADYHMAGETEAERTARLRALREAKEAAAAAAAQESAYDGPLD